MRLLPFRARPSDEAHRAATPLELFFHLVAVVAIASVTEAFHHEVSHGHAIGALLPYLMGVAGVWWVWANFTWFASSFDNDDAVYRILVFVIIAGFTVFAGGITYIFETLDARLGVAGEIILSASLFFGEMHGVDLRLDLAIGGGVTVAIVCMMWVYYFIEKDHLEAIGTTDRFVSWAYLHLIVYFAAALFGAASAAQLDVLTHHSDADPLHLSLLTNGAIAMYVFGIWLIRDRFLQHAPTFWGPLVSVAAFVCAGALQVPYWMTGLVLLITLLVRLNWPRPVRSK